MKSFQNVIGSGLLVGLLTAAIAITSTTDAQAQANPWGFESGVGLVAGLAGESAYSVAFIGDYYLQEAFSVGGIFRFTPGDDALSAYSAASAARFHIRQANGLNISPFTGLGILDASLKRGSGDTRLETADFGFYVPIGVSVEYSLNEHILLAGTASVNLHNLKFKDPIGRDRTSTAWMVGFRFRP